MAARFGRMPKKSHFADAYMLYDIYIHANGPGTATGLAYTQKTLVRILKKTHKLKNSYH